MFELAFYQNTQPAHQALVLGNDDVLFSHSDHHSKYSCAPTHLVGHEVREQHHMPPVDAHAVIDHRVLDFVDDRCPGSFNAQSFLHLWRARVSGSSHFWMPPPSLYALLCPEGSWQAPRPFQNQIFSGRPRANSCPRSSRNQLREIGRM